MSTKKETERSKLVQEKCQNLITQMLKDEDNKYCVDCDAKGPRWASWNLGVFLCIRCAGIHRNLGVHITRVKSVNLDTWTPEQVVSLQQMGNSRARAVYEAQLPDGFKRPQTDAALESFIRAKYEQKKYVAKEWVPSPSPKVDWEKEIDDELEKQKRKKKSLAAGGGGSAILGSLSSPSVEKKTTPASKTTPIPAPLPKPKSSAHSPKTGRPQLELSNTSSLSSSATVTSSNTLDLLGLTSPPPSGAATAAASSVHADHSNGGAASDDEFNNFFSANSQSRGAAGAATTTKAEKPGEPKSLAQEEADFFNQSVPSDAEKAKLTKDSIMALYGSQAVSAAPVTAPVTTAGAPTSNLSLLAGLGGPANGFPGQFQNNNNHNGGVGVGGFPTQQPTQQQQSHQQVPHPMVANNGLNNHFGGLSLGGPVNQQPQFGQQMQSQFLNGAPGGGFNSHPQFNSNGGVPGMIGQQHPQGMNFFPAAATGIGSNGFPMMGGGGQVKGGFTASNNNLMGQPPQTMMGTNGGGQFSYGMPGAPQMMPNGAVANGAQQQKQQNQFGNLNLGNVWQ